MDNYDAVIASIKIASKILNIEEPTFRVFTLDDLEKRNINAVYLKENNIIAFNELWLEEANVAEILLTSLHEARHAFQWEVITNVYTGSETIDENTKRLWKEEFNNYHSTTGFVENDKKYISQDIERDAIDFAYTTMLEYINIEESKYI